MKTIKVLKVDSFTDEPLQGNPAGVVLDAGHLSDEQMLRIAKELNTSETAFIMPSKIADYKLRFFASGGEVNLCGHATIAAFYALAIKNRIRGKDRITLRQETKAGVLPVDIYFKNGKVERIMMQQTQPQFLETIGREEIFPLLNLGKDHIRDIPCEVISTGLRLLVVPLDSLSTLKKLEPDFDRVRKFSKVHDIVGIHCFSTETFDRGSAAHSRFFAPVVGVYEDPVTGTASGALCCYLLKHGIIKGNRFVFEQGDIIGRKGRVFVEVSFKDGSADKIKVGGKVCLSMEGKLKTS